MSRHDSVRCIYLSTVFYFQETGSGTHAVLCHEGLLKCYWAHECRINEEIELEYAVFIKIFIGKIALLDRSLLLYV
jgi:hypothetical protein